MCRAVFLWYKVNDMLTALLTAVARQERKTNQIGGLHVFREANILPQYIRLRKDLR